MAELRQTVGAVGFEAAASLWFHKLLLRLDEVDDSADEPGSDVAELSDEGAARSVA